MSTSASFRRLRSALLAAGTLNCTDGQLLEYFVTHREPAALEALVRRHGPMVWRVCRHILGDYHDTEDAFQVTFLVLMRKAASIQPSSKVGNWLYGTAHQTAMKARANRTKRRLRERQHVQMPELGVVEPACCNDLKALVHEEIRRLPAKYRSVLVLCELEEKTGSQAGQQLGLPTGTVASRLARAKAMLKKQLARRGVMLPAGGVALLLSDNIMRAMPPGAMSPAIKRVLQVAAQAPAASGVSGKLMGILAEMRPALSHGKSKAMMAFMLVLGVIGLSGLALTRRADAGPEHLLAKPPPVLPRETQDDGRASQLFAAAPLSKPVAKNSANRLLFWENGRLAMVRPDGNDFQWITDKSTAEHAVAEYPAARLSSDGQRVVYRLDDKDKSGNPNFNRPGKLLIKQVGANGPGRELGVAGLCAVVGWARDRKGVVVRVDGGTQGKAHHWLVDVKTGHKRKLNIPAEHAAVDWSSDGKWFLTITTNRRGGIWSGSRMDMVRAEGGEPRSIGNPRQTVKGGCFSPDGRQVLFCAMEGGSLDGPRRLYVLDLAKNMAQPVSPIQRRDLLGYCWSPDGKKLAYCTQDNGRRRLTVTDADGKNAQVIMDNADIWLHDWR